MKLNITYLLLLLVISPNLYGAEAESSALAVKGAHDGFTGQTVKGLTEITEQWSQKGIPVEYVETGKGWEDREKFVNKEIDSRVVLGSIHKEISKPTIADAERDATVLATKRSLCAYHFVKSGYFAQSISTPLKKDAERIDLSTGKSEKIKQFKKAGIGRASCKAKIALKKSPVDRAAFSHELQKKALTIREKQLIEKNREAEALKAEIASFNLPMSNEFVFYINALINVYQSENNHTNSDEQTIDFIFHDGNDLFALQKQSFKTINKDNSEHVVNFGPFMKKNGRLPVEECGLQARKIYKTWYTLRGEPAEATELRNIQSELIAKRAELEQEQLVDRKEYIQNQIDILQESRDDKFEEIRTKVFNAAKLLTSKDLAAYNNIVNNKTRLAFAQGYLADEEEAIASAKQKIANLSAAIAATADDKGKEEA